MEIGRVVVGLAADGGAARAAEVVVLVAGGQNEEEALARGGRALALAQKRLSASNSLKESAMARSLDG